MKKVFGILIMGILVIGLTGCGESKGDSRFDYVIDEMNTAVEESYERNDGASVVTLEERFTQDISSARIVACGEKEFTEKVDLTKTSYTRNLDGYDGTIQYNSTRLSKDAKVNYEDNKKKLSYINVILDDHTALIRNIDKLFFNVNKWLYT